MFAYEIEKKGELKQHVPFAASHLLGAQNIFKSLLNSVQGMPRFYAMRGVPITLTNDKHTCLCILVNQSQLYNILVITTSSHQITLLAWPITPCKNLG